MCETKGSRIEQNNLFNVEDVGSVCIIFRARGSCTKQDKQGPEIGFLVLNKVSSKMNDICLKQGQGLKAFVARTVLYPNFS